MSGLLKGSFIPKEDIRHLRDLHRHRRKIIGMRTSEKNRLQNVLEDANIKLSSVVSDVFGKTGRAIIEAIIEGQTNPDILCQLAKGSLKTKIDQLHKALNGRITKPVSYTHLDVYKRQEQNPPAKVADIHNP